jgi:hypothetical protein
MIQLSLEFYASTAHLRPKDTEVWREFIAAVRKNERPDSLYSYDQLEAVLNT